MPRIVPRAVLAALLALGLAACKETETKYITVPGEIPACSTAYPIGACASGQSCFEGACVASATLCSADNLTGLCRDGYKCYAGGCILDDAYVPPGEPTDPCVVQLDAVQPALRFAAAVPLDAGGQPLGIAKAAITVDGRQFKDLSGDGALQRYEDWRYSPICRAQDLVARMTVPQKVGLMSEGGGLGNGTSDGSIPTSVVTFIKDQHGRQGLVRFGSVTAQQLAVYTNRIQALAETQPLGIPLAITGDPAHAVSNSIGVTGAMTQGVPALFTGWPGTLGLAAINDPALTEAHGDNVRREFRAVGLNWQLGPMADLSTEPRWDRVPGTLGSEAHAVGKHVAAIVRGFQGSSNGDLRNGIASTLKHFPGHGAQEGGRDPHNYYGRYTVYPGDNLAYHFIPFQYGFDEGAAAIMPCYSIYKNQTEWDPMQTPAGYSYQFITQLAKQAMNFTGMVTGDWQTAGQWSWNLNMLTGAEKAALWLAAGSHQFGLDPFSQFQDAYDQGLITEDQVDEAAVKILEMSFKLGLFENPYDDEATATTVKSAEDRTTAFEAQKRAIVLLRNQDHATSSIRYLPINGSRYTDAPGGTTGAPDLGEYHCDSTGDGTVRVYYDGVVDSIVADPEKPDGVNDLLGDYDYTSAAAGTTLAVAATSSFADADIAIIRVVSRRESAVGSAGTTRTLSVPLSFDGELTPEEAGYITDGTLSVAAASKKKIIDALRARDGYLDSTGATVDPVNSDLKIVLVMSLQRPGIVRPFVQGLVSLDEAPGVPGSYPSVSNEANIRQVANGGVDALLVDFGAFDRAVLDFVFNAHVPTGVTYGSARLPLEIPSTDAAVKAQFEDLPNDSWYPTYQVGAGSALPAN